MALLDNVVDITVFIGALALLIMSSIILGSANKIQPATADTKLIQSKKDIKNTSTLLLIISIIVFVLYGYKLYQSYMGGKESKGSVTYFF